MSDPRPPSNDSPVTDHRTRLAAKSASLSPRATASPDIAASSHPTTLQHEPSLQGFQDDAAVETEPSAPEVPGAPEAIEGVEGTEEEHEGGGGAFNPVTGEINWDCPCLGGMAYGPCGPEFREAFSCFVYSEQEPKGIECVEKFKAMQDCFRAHPDVYKDGK